MGKTFTNRLYALSVKKFLKHSFIYIYVLNKKETTIQDTSALKVSTTGKNLINKKGKVYFIYVSDTKRSLCLPKIIELNKNKNSILYKNTIYNIEYLEKTTIKKAFNRWVGFFNTKKEYSLMSSISNNYIKSKLLLTIWFKKESTKKVFESRTSKLLFVIKRN